MKQSESVHARQLDIGNNQVRLKFCEALESFLAAGDAEQLVSPFSQQRLISGTSILFVFDNQNSIGCAGFIRHSRSSLGSDSVYLKKSTSSGAGKPSGQG